MKVFKFIYIRTICNTSLDSQRPVLLEMHSGPFDSRPFPDRLPLGAFALLSCSLSLQFRLAACVVRFGEDGVALMCLCTSLTPAQGYKHGQCCADA